MTSRPMIFAFAIALLVAGGCKPKAAGITSLQRKEAATLASEAKFAEQLRDYARAEGLLTKAAALCPDNAKYWVDVGVLRMRLGNRDGARAAYRTALYTYEDQAARNKEPQPLLQQANVLALLGRMEDARAVLAKARKDFPDSREVRNHTEGGEFARIIADPRFKEVAF